jgi:hypothetical protein
MIVSIFQLYAKHCTRNSFVWKTEACGVHINSSLSSVALWAASEEIAPTLEYQLG